MPKRRKRAETLEIFLIYLRLGCLSFGGPVAHLGYFKDEFVSRRKWLDDASYAELLGLCQFVPGPSSSQLSFAIGWHHGGLAGACAAWLGFALPSTILMIGFGYGLFALEGTAEPLTHGLLIAAVAVVANATLGLGNKLCPDLPRMAIAMLAATLVLNFPSSLTPVGAIILGALIGQWLKPTQELDASNPIATTSPYSIGRTLIFGALALYALLLTISLLVEPSTPGAIYALHYRAGALVFGGGHIVLPLLNESIVAGGLVSETNFLAGYSAAQALPGPLFTLAAFLGTVGAGTSPAAVGGILALIAIFLPGLLLLIGLLPFWSIIRQKKWAQAGLTGANAAVVGLLIAALIHPVWTHGIQTITDFGIGFLAFFALYRYKLPAWLVVIGTGVLGYIFY
ncbi:chromate efflux transporter [Coraliomargarita sp. W4R53]